MGYRIVYGKSPGKRVNFLPLQTWIALALLLFVVSVRLSWPEGTEQLQKIFVSDNLSRDAEALVAMAENLAAGKDVQEAVAVFCQEIFGGK